MAFKRFTQQEANDSFTYIDGELYLKAGSVNSYGYLTVRHNNKIELAHRVIFLMHHSYLPEIVDHIDNNPLNNKIENLRAANRSTNGMNKKLRCDSTSGVKNVSWHKLRSTWQVSLNVNKKRKCIGYFKDLELADLVAQEARILYHGQFARHH